jgi:hypothetical protein
MEASQTPCEWRIGFEVERENAMGELGGMPGNTQVAAFVCLWLRHSQLIGPSLKSYIERACPIQGDCRSSEGLGAMRTLQALTALARPKLCAASCRVMPRPGAGSVNR